MPRPGWRGPVPPGRRRQGVLAHPLGGDLRKVRRAGARRRGLRQRRRGREVVGLDRRRVRIGRRLGRCRLRQPLVGRRISDRRPGRRHRRAPPPAPDRVAGVGLPAGWLPARQWAVRPGCAGSWWPSLWAARGPPAVVAAGRIPPDATLSACPNRNLSPGSEKMLSQVCDDKKTPEPGSGGIVVGRPGLEPGTTSLKGRCST